MLSFEELLPLFISKPQEAITKSQQLICCVTGFSSYKEFYSFHLEHAHMSTCQKEWSKPQMSIHCFDCANNPQSCVCLQCFLNGNHKGHDYIIRGNSAGNCDCGDLSLWKRSGFCSEHHGVEEDSHPENYLDEKLRTALTDIIFKAAFSSIPKLNDDEDTKISEIIQFISSFLRFGDGFRRLITISFTEKVDTRSIFYNIFERSSEFNQELQQLCGSLVNDDVFRCRISQIVYDIIIEKIIPTEFEEPMKKDRNYQAWDMFWFHSFSPRPIEYNITKLNWDWVTFTLKFSTLMKENFNLLGKLSLEYKGSSYPTEITTNIPSAYRAQTIEQTQRLFDEMFTNVLNKDGVVVASFSDVYQENYYRSLYSFKAIFYSLIDCFKLKKDLKIDKLIDELDKSINISSIFCIGKNFVGNSNVNENDKFISKFLKKSENEDVDEKYFKSFHNGSSFFYSLPLYDSLAYLFRTDNMNRVKIARFLSTEKYQSLRVQLGIITLKNILSYACLHQSLTSQNNHSLKIFMQAFLRRTLLDFSIPLYLPLFQLLLGLQCNDKNVTDEFSLKEFFAFEMARETGLFDDFESEDYSDEEILPLKKQMIFSVLYYAILIVLERTLFNFNSFNFIEEQIIIALKEGISQLDDLSKSFDSEIDPHSRQTFIKILSNVATTNRNSEKNDDKEKKESSFYLKKEVDWKSITSLNLINSQKVILENEIVKNPNMLIKIPDFEQEEDYFFKEPKGYQPQHSINEYEIDATGLNIRLKEFLFTPTILAICYQALRSNSEEANQKIDLNDHFAMMVLVLISRFVNENDDSSSFNESTVIQYDSTLVDLILKLKQTIFNLNNDTIKNTLNKKSFYTFLKIKIGTSNLKPKSFIDILLEKSEIGKNVLSQMSIDISQYGFKTSNSELSKEQINKKRANKLKEEIMNQYKSAISNYNLVELDQLDETPSSSVTVGETCSICSTLKKDEILSYTVYMYRTKIPFIFDKPPLLKYNPRFEIPVDSDVNDIIIDYFDLLPYGTSFEGEEEEEECEPDLEEMLEGLQTPTNEEEYLMYLLNRQQIYDDYQEKLQKQILKEVVRNNEKKKKEHEEKVGSKTISDTEERITAGSNFVIQFSTCQHPVHPSCIGKSKFNCPIDRSLRNGFLPAIDGLPKEKIFKDNCEDYVVKPGSLRDEISQSISKFFHCFVPYFQISDINVELVKSISGLISTYEVRLRALPDCLDSSKTKILSRNLFLTTWYYYRMTGKEEMHVDVDNYVDVETRLTPFQILIKRLIQCDEIIQPENNSVYTDHIKEVFIGIVSSIINSDKFSNSTDPIRKQKEIYLFLKRVCLSDYFLLNNNKISPEGEILSNLLDWDEILSVSNLSKYYNVKLDGLINNENGSEFEFKPFVFSKLPKEFLHFALKPYNFNVDCTQQFVMFNIIDYNYLIKHYDDFGDDVENEDEELKKNQRNVTVFKPGTNDIDTILIMKYSKCVYPSVFLSIGKYSPRVIIVNGNRLNSLKSFYLDRFGCEDIGYKRGMPLFLNEDKYERVIDEILSGDFSFYFDE